MIAATLAQVMRADRGRLLAALIARTGDFQRAEDALQEAAASALVHWGRAGVPANPTGWLLRAALRKAIDGYQNLIPNIDLQLATRNAPGSTGAVALSAASVRTGNDGFAYFSVEGTVAGEVQIVVNAPGRPEAELMSVNVLAP